jgi:hypothetical protein
MQGTGARGRTSALGLFSALATLITRLENGVAYDAGIIPWGSPVPSFGDLANARVASLGLNPSNREFVDDHGKELTGERRRFHTLRSLELQSWADADARHLERILAACQSYFARNPYDRWFRPLDLVVSGTGASFYDAVRPACHLDVIPYATTSKWTELSVGQRSQLLQLSCDSLGLLLRHTAVQVLILNGQSVVMHFQDATGICLDRREMRSWSLPRQSGDDVRGIAYHGVVDTISGYRLGQDLLVLGYNHNLQSSYGVTAAVVKSIRRWVSDSASQVLQ